VRLFSCVRMDHVCFVHNKNPYCDITMDLCFWVDSSRPLLAGLPCILVLGGLALPEFQPVGGFRDPLCCYYSDAGNDLSRLDVPR